MNGQLLQDLLEEQAQRRPDATAIVSGEDCLTYAELNKQANSLAWTLLQAGCNPGDRIGLLLPKSPIAIVSMFAALKAGCIYVPLDVDSPATRLVTILESASCRILLASSGTVTLAQDLAGRGLGPVIVGLVGSDFGTEATGAVFHWKLSEKEPSPSAVGVPSDVVHLLFTSGSTGKPKGVMITHGNVLSFVHWAVDYFGYTAEDRISGHPPLHFDLSTLDVYGTLAAGAQLHLISPRLNYLPQKIAELIRRSELTQWFSVPSLLSYMAKFDVVRQNDFPHLKRLLWCGERFPTPALRYWMKRLPHVEFTNLYGPTEATIASSFYRVPECPPSDDVTIPIGRACAGESLLVLDDQLHPSATGEIGDLYIGGVGLSPGYWRDAEKTRTVFLDDPFGPGSSRIYKTGDLASVGADGLIYLHGRSDAQIKSRGYRIELGEIETALQATDCIQEAAVVAVDNGGFEGAVICCAVVLAPGVSFEPQRIRAALAERLPPYMLPTRWLHFETLPLNGNGKVDKPALRERFREVEAVGILPAHAPVASVRQSGANHASSSR